MRRLLSCCCFLVVLIATPTLARAQCDEFYGVYDAFLTATFDGAAMQVRLSLGCGRSWWPTTGRGNAVAFDVFRRTLGYECGPEERVTDQPLAWPVTEDDVFEITFTDASVTPNTAYRYEARPVDAERNPARGEQVSGVWGYGVAGVALLAHGQLLQDDFPWVNVGECPGECFVSALVTGPGLSETPLPWGSTVNLYGSSVYVNHDFNIWSTYLWVTSINPAQCIVAVESVKWGMVKRLFR